MPYELAPGESASQSVLRIAAEQIDRALSHLADAASAPEERVHETRKRIKEMRALLRLARFVLRDDFELENVWYRDAARSLSAARDAEAVLEAIEKLRAGARDGDEHTAVKEAKWALRNAQREESLADTDAAIARLQPSLALSRVRLTTWPPNGWSIAALARGFERTYADGRRAMRAVIDDPRAERFHEWRKRVKDHWYHVQLLRNVSPEMTGRMAALQQLSRDLGDHHDLVVLADGIGSGALLADCEADVRNVVLELAGRRRAALEQNAVAAGSMLYAEKAASFGKRMESAWKAAAR
ncbi:MAG: CHAD domain-containing protein [Thermoanaerobaculia bacterium]